MQRVRETAARADGEHLRNRVVGSRLLTQPLLLVATRRMRTAGRRWPRACRVQHSLTAGRTEGAPNPQKPWCEVASAGDATSGSMTLSVIQPFVAAGSAARVLAWVRSSGVRIWSGSCGRGSACEVRQNGCGSRPPRDRRCANWRDRHHERPADLGALAPHTRPRITIRLVRWLTIEPSGQPWLRRCPRTLIVRFITFPALNIRR